VFFSGGCRQRQTLILRIIKSVPPLCKAMVTHLGCARRRLPAGWPTDGAIEVQSLEVRYRPDLEPVLNGISFAVKGMAIAQAL